MKAAYLSTEVMRDLLAFVTCYILFLPSIEMAELEYCGNGNTAKTCSLNAKQTFEDAQNRCSLVGEEWTLLYDISHIQHKADIADELGVLPVWFDMHQQTLENWTTVTGEPVNNIKINGDNPKGECATVEVQQDDILAAASCVHHPNLPQPNGFICEFKRDCKWHMQDLCFHIAKDRALYFGYNANVLNWTAARAWCIEHGGDLAVPKSPDEIRKIVNYIAKHVLNGNRRSPGSYFVGIAKRQWISQETGKSSHLFWAPGQPGDGSCVIVTRNGWNTTSCTSKYATVCQLKVPSKVSDSHSETDKVMEGNDGEHKARLPDLHIDEQKIHKENNLLIIILLSFVALILVLLLVAIFIIVFLCHKVKDLSNRSNQSKENDKKLDDHEKGCSEEDTMVQEENTADKTSMSNQGNEKEQELDDQEKDFNEKDTMIQKENTANKTSM